MSVIDTEYFSRALAEEITPLAQKCWDESTTLKGKACSFYGQRDLKVQPDIDQYERMASVTRVITLRDQGRLCGYIVGFVISSLHYKGILCGFGDSMYVEKDYRGRSGEMVERFESEMSQLGARIIGWPVTRHSAVHTALKKRGFVADDVVMEKLCVSH